MPQATTRTLCTAQENDGTFCDGPSAPDAPFPICVTHLGRIAAYINSVATPEKVYALRWAARKFDQAGTKSERPRRAPYEDVVYYARIGDLVKIGHTRDLRARMANYPPSAILLATEPGSRPEEVRRLRQFNRYLAQGREWFHPSAELIDHINSLRETPLTAAELAA